MPNAVQATVTLKHLAAALAAQHELAKKRSEEILSDAIGLVTKHLKKGNRHPDRRPRHPAGPQARRSYGTQPGDR